MLLYRIAKKAYIEDLSGLGSRLYGGRWNENFSVAIKVRSVILPSQYEKDFNVILNPEHPAFGKLTVKTVVECPFDLR